MFLQIDSMEKSKRHNKIAKYSYLDIDVANKLKQLASESKLSENHIINLAINAIDKIDIIPIKKQM